MKTAMKEIIEYIESLPDYKNGKNEILADVNYTAHELLGKEKKQIMDAWIGGNAGRSADFANKYAEQYFTKTYSQLKQ